jgi:two-component system OmpR family sensor kinase
MRRLLYRLFLINFTTFLITLLAVVVVRLLIDSDTTPLGRAQLAVSLGTDLEQPAEDIEARLAMMRVEFGGRTTAYTVEGELIASNVDPPLPFAVEHNSPSLARFATYDIAGNQTGWLVFGPLPGVVVNEVGRVMLLALIVAGAVGLALAFLITRRLVEPLTRLTEAARSVGRGQFDVQVAVDRRDEVGVLGRAFDDMTRKLALLQRSQRELLASVSHEFRTPLARMRVVHAMLQEGEADEVRELLPELVTDLDELERLVDGVLGAAKLDLDLSRDAVATRAPREPITGRDLVDRVAARFRLAHPERELIVEIGEDLGTLDADVPALLRACDNLLDNGLRHGPAARPLRMSATSESDQLAIAFADEGPGIAAELHELVFSPFFRVDRSRSRETGGLGLGLTIVTRILEAHGGRVGVDSKPAAGAVFTIRLPRRP